MIGYFQINPDGSFHSPVLPDLDEAELSANAERFGFGSSELARRLALRSRIEALLRAGAPTTDRRKRQQHAAQSSAVPAPMASAPAALTLEQAVSLCARISPLHPAQTLHRHRSTRLCHNRNSP